MCNPLAPDKAPEAMTPLIRRWLMIAAIRNALFAAVIMLAPATFGSVIYHSLRTFPMAMWAGLLLLVAVFCGYAAYARCADCGRVSLVASSVLNAVVTVLLLMGAVEAWWGAAELAHAVGHPWWHYFRDPGAPLIPSAMLPLAMASLVAKDALICAQPFRDPWRRVIAAKGA